VFQSLKRDNCLSNSKPANLPVVVLNLCFNRSSATIASPTWHHHRDRESWHHVSIAQARQLPLQPVEIGVFGLGPHRFQSLKRDNCLSNLEHFPLFQLLTGVSIAQARQLPLQPSCSPTSCTWHAGVSIAQARQLPLQPTTESSSLTALPPRFQSLKRDNCLSNSPQLSLGNNTSPSFNRSSATIASPTLFENAVLVGTSTRFQSLKRDNCLSNKSAALCIADVRAGFNRSSATIASPTQNIIELQRRVVGVSIAQARQLPLQRPLFVYYNYCIVEGFNRSSATIASPTQRHIPGTTKSALSFNRSSATIASPTNTEGAKHVTNVNVSIAQARQLPLQRRCMCMAQRQGRRFNRSSATIASPT